MVDELTEHCYDGIHSRFKDHKSMPLLMPYATLCFIHIFGCEDTPTNIGKVLCVVVKTVKHIQDSATNFRLFKMSCEEVGPECRIFISVSYRSLLAITKDSATNRRNNTVL